LHLFGQLGKPNWQFLSPMYYNGVNDESTTMRKEGEK
jgi:hypothetical protein